MARIVLTTLGSYGDLNPYLVLGNGLRARGHQVILATSTLYRAEIERAGLAFAATGPEMQLDTATYERVMHRWKGPETVIREIVMPHLRELYADLERAADGADLLITHVLTFAGPVLAEKKGMKWLSTILSPMVFFSAYDPPVLPPVPWLAALRVLGARVNGPLLRALRTIPHSWGNPVRALRRELGLTPGKDPMFEGQHSPYGVLALFSKVFGPPQPDWPANTRACGFLFREDDIGGAPLHPDLERFISAGPPPLVFTLGSTAVNIAHDFYRVAAECARRLGRRAVLLAGEAADALRAQIGSPTVLAVRSAPYGWLFPKAGALILSGGVGTTAQALAAGKPMVVIPFAHDQFDNAARVERLGAGLSLPRQAVNIPRLTALLNRVLSDESFAARAAAVGNEVRAEKGLENAIEAVEQVLAGETLAKQGGSR